jgi:hypothetical protein
MASTYIDDLNFKHRLSPDQLREAVHVIAEARVAAEAMDKQLARALPGSLAAEQARQLMLGSSASILYSAVRANKKIKPRKRASLDRCLELATTLNLSRAIDEVSIIRPRLKKSGVLAVTHEFGIVGRTAHDIVGRIMQREIKPRPFQYGNRGVHRAIKEAKKLVNAGYIYTARLDIRDYFGSFTLEKLAIELPLPKEVVENAVVARHIKVKWEKDHWYRQHGHIPFPHTDHLITLACRGLPAGSSCSQLVAEFMLAKLQWTLSPGLALLNYVDDFLLMALDEATLQKGIRALQEAVTKLRGGCFELILLEKNSALKGFEFLGHHLKLANGSLLTTVASKPSDVFTGKTAKQLAKVSDLQLIPGVISKQRALKLLAGTYATAKGWAAAFSEADDVKQYVDYALSGIVDEAKTLGVTPDQIAATVDDSIRFKVSDYLLTAEEGLNF